MSKSMCIRQLAHEVSSIYSLATEGEYWSNMMGPSISSRIWDIADQEAEALCLANGRTLNEVMQMVHQIEEEELAAYLAAHQSLPNCP